MEYWNSYPQLTVNLEKLLIDYKINPEEIYYFYVITLVYATSVKAGKISDEIEKSPKQNKEMQKIIDFFAKFTDEPKIKSLTIERAKGDFVKIESELILKIFFNKYIFKNYKKEILNNKTLIYSVKKSPKEGKFQGRASNVKILIRSLNSYLRNFNGQYHINYDSLTLPNKSPDKSPETFVHDFLYGIGLIYQLLPRRWEDVINDSKMTYAGKIDFCKKVLF